MQLISSDRHGFAPSLQSRLICQLPLHMNQLHENLSTFLQPYLSTNHHNQERPLVILTWAQSLDAKISAGRGKQTVLSCLETKYMTHLIRRKTDAILIGAETAVTDNPSLNGIKLPSIKLMVARFPIDGLDGEWVAAEPHEQPRPVILDPHCRAHLPKLLHLVSQNKAKSPWILCREGIEKSDERHIPLKLHRGKFSWADILSNLSVRGIKSVMVEGGARVIGDVLSERLADVIIITVAPVFLGHDGVGISAHLQEPDWLHDVRYLSVGNDIVTAGRVRKDQ